MLLGLFKTFNGWVSDSPKVVNFLRIRYGYVKKSEDSAKLRITVKLVKIQFIQKCKNEGLYSKEVTFDGFGCLGLHR